MKRVSVYSAVLFCLAQAAPTVCSAQTVVRRTGDESACTETKKENSTETYYICDQKGHALKGLHWGPALVFDSSRGGIGEVQIVKEGANNVVRVLKDDKSAARAAFELHYFFPVAYKADNETPIWSLGPFISLNTKPLDDFKGQVFTSAGIGLIAGTQVGTNNAINFGIGWLVDTDVKRLRPEFADGTVTTLTPGQENQLLKSTTSQGFMAMLSFSFKLGN